MDREEEIALLSSLVESRGWTEVLAPLLEKRYIGALNRLLVGRGTLADLEVRALLGDAANAQWLRTYPQAMIEEWNREVEERIEKEKQEEMLDARGAYLAEHGMAAPFAPQPGDEEERS